MKHSRREFVSTGIAGVAGLYAAGSAPALAQGATALPAEDGYKLWLRYASPGAIVSQYRAALGQVLVEGSSPTSAGDSRRTESGARFNARQRAGVAGDADRARAGRRHSIELRRGPSPRLAGGADQARPGRFHHPHRAGAEAARDCRRVRRRDRRALRHLSPAAAAADRTADRRSSRSRSVRACSFGCSITGTTSTARSSAGMPADRSGSGTTCPGKVEPPLRGLRARQRLDRHQRRGRQQRQRRRPRPDRGVPAEGRGAGGRVAAVWRAHLPVGELRRADPHRRPEDGGSARSRGGGMVEGEGATRSTRSSPTSAASSSRPTPKGSPVRRTTGARTPRARTCSPTRSRRTTATSSGARSSTTRTSIPTARSAPTSSSWSSTAQFRPNVLVQVKNGAIDFMPREPFHPLFGAMQKTPVLAEIQATQEYLGQAKHLVYLGTMWKEFLDADTHAKGAGLDGRQGASTGEINPYRGDRHGVGRQSGPRSQLVRPSLLAVQLVRVRAGWPGTPNSRRADRRRMDADDVHATTPKTVATIRDMMMSLARDLRELHDAARACIT